MIRLWVHWWRLSLFPNMVYFTCHNHNIEHLSRRHPLALYHMQLTGRWNFAHQQSNSGPPAEQATDLTTVPLNCILLPRMTFHGLLPWITSYELLHGLHPMDCFSWIMSSRLHLVRYKMQSLKTWQALIFILDLIKSQRNLIISSYRWVGC